MVDTRNLPSTTSLVQAVPTRRGGMGPAPGVVVLASRSSTERLHAKKGPYCTGVARSLREGVQPHWSTEVQMTDSVYKVVTLIGSSTESWESAAKAAVEAASHSLRELRIAEVVKQDLVITDGKVEAYRTKVRVSFKYEGNE